MIPTSPDLSKIRREGLRWNLINTLNLNRPFTTAETWLLDVMRASYPDVSGLEVRKELDYLMDRELITITKQPSGMWFADLTRHGVDIAEYTIDCEAGIARPPKYWA